MIEMLRRSIGPLIQVETAFADDLWPTHVDANQLELALLNLVVNGRDAMPDGGRRTLSVRNATIAAAPDGGLAAGDYVRLALVDTGTGMDEATLARATEPFFTAKSAGKVTGLGLSMVHGLAPPSRAARCAWRAGRQGRAVAAPGPCPARHRRAGPGGAAGPALLYRLAGRRRRIDQHRDLRDAEGSGALGGRGAIGRQGAGNPARRHAHRRGGIGRCDAGHEGYSTRRRDPHVVPDVPVILATGYADLPKDSEVNLPLLRKPYAQEDLAAAIVKVMELKARPAR